MKHYGVHWREIALICEEIRDFDMKIAYYSYLNGRISEDTVFSEGMIEVPFFQSKKQEEYMNSLEVAIEAFSNRAAELDESRGFPF